jgi:peptide/nickel transport system permease protein
MTKMEARIRRLSDRWSSSLFRQHWTRFKKNKASVIAGCFLLLIYIAAIIAPYITPHDALEIHLKDRLLAPNQTYWLGTDDLGRDVLSRLMMGARVSLSVGFIAAGLSMVIGVWMGLMAGFFGKPVDTIISGLVDILMSIPALLLILAVVAIVPPSLINIMIILGLTMWAQYARVVRGSVLTLKQQDFVEGARAIGASRVRIMTRYLLPNVLAPIIVMATVNVAGAILLESSLSFLGYGVQPPTASWGSMIGTGRTFLRQAPHLATSAGLAIFFTVLAFNLVGDGLRDAFDPRQKNK